MARVCQLTGKKTTSGNNRPFSLKATKRTFRPNLFYKRVFNPLSGKVERMRLSAKAIRTLKKWANQGAEMAEVEETKAAKNAEGTGKHVKVKKLTPKQKKEAAATKAEITKKAPLEEAKSE